MKKYIVDEKRLKSLLKKEIELEALECAGVDNWGFYGEHWDMYFETGDFGDNDSRYTDVDEMIEVDVLTSIKNFEVLDPYESVKEDIRYCAEVDEVELTELEVSSLIDYVFKFDYADYNDHIRDCIQYVVDKREDDKDGEEENSKHNK